MLWIVSRRLFYRFFISVLSLLLALYPDIVYAQQAASSIIVDNTTDPSAAAPSLDRTANGVEQLNIATPNSTGLSHNLFTQYNVEQKGLILNNATEATQTQLGGYVYANSNLKGSSAKVILNEVTGQQASQMLGYTEVAGQKANVVIVNPNGITCNGCGFLNTARVTLASGHPELDASGALSALTVTDGLVAFGRGGGNFTAVPVLDIFSRRIVLDGQVNAQNVQMAAGRNRIDYSSGVVHPLTSDGSQAPEFAIDSSAFGGMYAGRISMLVNEAGAGVRVDGQMAANAGDMTLTADGQLVLNGSMSATGNITVTAGDIQNIGMLQAGGSTQVVSIGAISNTGHFTAGQGLSVAGTDIRNFGALNAAGTAGVIVAARGSLVNDGNVGAVAGAARLHGGHIANDTGGTIAAQTGLTLQSDAEITNAGVLGAATGSVWLTAQGSISQTNGQIAAQGGDLQVAASSLTGDGNSSITARGGIQLNVLELSNFGRIFAGNSLALRSAAVLTNTGTLEGDRSVTIQAGTFANGGTLASRQGSLDIVAFDGIQNSGTLYGVTTTAIVTGRTLNNEGGQIGAGTGAITVTAGPVDNTGGKIVASTGPITVQASGDVRNTNGTISATGSDLTLSGGQLINDGTGALYASGDLKANLSDYSADAQASAMAAGQLTLMATGTVRTDGVVLSAGSLTVAAQQGMTIEAGGAMTAQNGSFTLTAGDGGVFNAGSMGTATSGDVKVSTSQFVNTGLLQSNGSLSVTAADGVTNGAGGQIIAQVGDLTVKAGALKNSANGLIAARNGNASVTVTGSQHFANAAQGLINAGTIETVAPAAGLTVDTTTLTNDGAMLANGGLMVTASAAVANDGKLGALGGDLSLSATSLTNNGTLAASGQMTASTGGGTLLNTGIVYGTAGLTLMTGALTNSSGGQIGTGEGNITLTAASVDNEDGTILATAGVLAMQAGLITNHAGVLQGGAGLTLKADALVNEVGGEILAQGGMLRLSGRVTADIGSLTNIGATLQGATGLLVQADQIDNTGGTILANGGVTIQSAVSGVLLNNGGIVQSTSSLTLSGGTYASDSGSVLDTSGAMTLIFAGQIVNAGHIDATQDLTLSAGSLATQNGGTPDTVSMIASTGGNVTVTVSGAVNDGVIQASNGSIDLTFGALTNGGTIAAQRNVAVATTEQATNMGMMIARGGDLTLSGGDVSNGGFVGASGLSRVEASSVLTNTGTVFGGGGATVSAGSDLSNRDGQIGATSGTVVATAGGRLDDSGGRIVAQGGDTTLTALGFVNQGGIFQASGGLYLTGDILDNRGGTVLASGGSVVLTSNGNAPGALQNSNGTIQAAGGVTAAFSSLSNDGGRILAQNGDLRLAGTADSAVANQGGAIQATGTVSLSGGSYASDGGSQVTAGGPMTLSFGGAADNAGQIASVGGLTLGAGSFSNDNGAVLASTQGALALALSGSAGLINTGTIETLEPGQSLSVTAVTVSNQAGGSILSHGLQSLIVAGALTNEGEITAYDSPLTVQAAGVSNENLLLAGGELSLGVSGDLTNSGLIYGLMGATVSAATLNNQSGQVGAGGGTVELAAGMLDNRHNGRVIDSHGAVQVQAEQVANDNGLIQGGTDIGLMASSLSNTGGQLQAGGSLVVYAANLDNTTGTILTTGGDIVLSGSGHAMQELNDTNGTLQSGRDLTVVTTSLTGMDSLQAQRNLTFTTSQGVDGGTLFSAGGDMTLSLGQAYQVDAGAGVIAGGNAWISAPSVRNGGALMAGGRLTVSTSGDIVNAGLIEGAGGVTLALDGNLENIQAAVLSDGGSIAVNGLSGSFAGDVTNSSGEILTGSSSGDVTIAARSLTNNIVGGVKYVQGAIVYDKTYATAMDTSKGYPGLAIPITSVIAQHYYGRELIEVPTPVGLLTADGQPGSGHFLASMWDGNGGSFVVVQGIGSEASAANAAGLIDAGHDLTIATSGTITNDAGHLAAGHDINLSGASLENVGYQTSVTYTVTCHDGTACRWYMPATDGPNPAFNGGWAINTTNGQWSPEVWGSVTSNALSGTIVAGNDLSGSFTDQVNNTTVVTHASSAQLAAAGTYGGSTPGGISALSPSSGSAAGGIGLSMPPSDGAFAGVGTGLPAGASGVGGVSGGTLQSAFVSVPVRAASGQSGASGLSVGGGTGSSPNSATLGQGGILPAEGRETGAMAAQSLILPGFVTTSDPSVSQVIASIPAGAALYIPNPSPTAGYLIETNPRYTSLKAFDGSEYLLDRLGAQPQDYVFLGDDSFDQRYVQQQIITATGQSYLGTTYTTAAAQMQALIDNAATQSSSLGLTLGQALTPTQQSQLTSDMVWYVSKDVGGKSVLVPTLYLASGHEALIGATITAKNVSLTASSITNSGTITGSNSLDLAATSGNITNTGALSGGDVSLAAQNGSIINNDTLNDYVVTGGTQGQLASVGKITATGSAVLAAAKDITFNGGTLSAGSDLSVIAGNSLSLGNTTLKQATSASSWQLSMNASAIQNYGTSISAGGNATLAALGGDLTAGGATLTTGGDLTLSAAKTLDLGSVTNSSTMDVSGHKSGFLTHSSFTNNQSSTTEVGSTVAAGGTLTAVSGGDMTVKGILGATGDATLLSGGSFTESATKSTSDVSASHHVSGFSLSTQGASGTIGYGSRTDSYSESVTQYTPSVIASLSGSLNIASTGKATVDASVISAAKDVLLSGSSVAFTTEQDTATQTVSHKDKSIGLTGGVSPNSIVGQIIDTALSATQTSGKGSTTLSTLDAMQGAYLAGTGIAAGLQSGAGKLLSVGSDGSASGNTDLIGVQAGIGFSSHSQSLTQSETDVQGSTATAGGTLSVVARGDSASDTANGALSAVAAQLSGQNIVLAAQQGISLSAGRDVTTSDSRYSSKSAFLGVEGSVGTNGLGLSVAASVGSQKQNAVSDSSTAVDTTVRASDGVSVTTPGSLTLNGAEIFGQRVDVSAGALGITSPQNTSDYRSSATQAGANLSVSWLGAGATGGGASYTHQTITDHFATTEGTLSGLYAGAQGLGVDVGGNTSLTAGVLSSTAAAALNHFNTGSLTAQGIENISTWQAIQTGASFSAGSDMMGSTTGILGAVGTGLASGASGLMGGGRSNSESSESVSAIGGNISVTAGSTAGSYTRDVSMADRVLHNAFDAQSLDNQLQAQQIGSQLVGEVGGQVSDALQNAGVPGFDSTNVLNAWGRIGLEVAGNAVIAAVTGGDAASAAASTAAGDGASIASRDWAYSVAKTFTSDQADQTVIANALSNIIASGAGAIGGTISGQSGKSSINALNGATAASAIQQFNQANENEKTVEQSDLPAGYTGTSQTDSPDIIQTVYSDHYAKQYDLVGDITSPVRDSNGNVIFRDKDTGDYFVFVGGAQQIPTIPQTKSGNHSGSQQRQSIIAQVDPQTGQDIYTQVEKQTALNSLQNSNLSYLLKQDGSFIGTPGTGHAQVMPGSSDPNATAETFAKQAFGNRTPVTLKPIIVNGLSGWYATFTDGTAVTYRPVGAASFRTPNNMATVEINTGNINTLNSGRVLKLKFPGE